MLKDRALLPHEVKTGRVIQQLTWIGEQVFAVVAKQRQ
jgi:hypothetical protein